MRRVLASAILALTIGCYDQKPNGGESVSGAYTLRSVNAAPLPVTTSATEATRIELLDDSYTLYDGSTYAKLGHIRTTVNGTATGTAVSEAGSFVSLGTSLYFHAAGSSVEIIAIYSSNTLTFTDAGKRFVYTK